MVSSIVNKKYIAWIFILLLAVTLTACSGDGNTDTTDAAKPQPQVRVELKPTYTPNPEATIAPTEELAAEATVATNQGVYVDPTPDSDAIANQIDAMMSDIDRILKSQNFTLKP